MDVAGQDDPRAIIEEQKKSSHDYLRGNGDAMTWEIRHGNCMELLRAMPESSVQCCITSPPYWGLRSYKTEPQVWGGEAEHEHEWMLTSSREYQPGQGREEMAKIWTTGGKPKAGDTELRVGMAVQQGICSCGAWRGELGLEPTPELYVQHIVEVFREVRRVLRKDGTLWLNLGDSYTSGGRGTYPTSDQIQHGKQSTHRAWNEDDGGTGTVRPAIPLGLKPKDLCGMPWRVAFALQAEGWWLRSDIIWAKPNPMPESVTDRPTKAHEYLFLLAKSPHYYFDQEAVKELNSQGAIERFGKNNQISVNNKYEGMDGESAAAMRASEWRNIGRNLRTVWTISTQAFPDAHFATFPENLVKPCILAGTSQAGCCPECGMPLKRIIEPTVEYARVLAERKEQSRRRNDNSEYFGTTRGTSNPNITATYETIGWIVNCNCGVCDVKPCTVLDPFCGSGTTGVVALKLQRSFMGLELQPTYVEMARKRIGEVMPLFMEESHALPQMPG